MKNNELMVSICCVTYNHVNFIAQCLDGFVKQKTNFEFEILVHDDASTDGTIEIVKSYEEKYPNLFKCVYQTENQFLKQNTLVNILFKMAKGKYIALCEGDDYWIDPYKLQKQVDFLEGNEEYSASAHNVDFIINDVVDSITPNLKNADLDIENILFDKYYNFIPTCSIVFRSEIVNNGFTLWFRDFGDWPILVECCLRGKIRFFQESMGVYRKHDSGFTSIHLDMMLILTIKFYVTISLRFPHFSPKCIEKIKQIESEILNTRIRERKDLLSNKNLSQILGYRKILKILKFKITRAT
jgi:glycosyltransferase involved in cell wall biosynthesis